MKTKLNQEKWEIIIATWDVDRKRTAKNLSFTGYYPEEVKMMCCQLWD